MFPVLRDEPLYFEVIEEVSHPNRKGYNTTVKLRANGMVRKIVPGDHDLYNRVIAWAREGKVRFVDHQPLRPVMKGSARVGD